MAYRIVYPGKPLKCRKNRKWIALFAVGFLIAGSYLFLRRTPTQWIAGNGSKTVEAMEIWAEDVKPDEKIDEIVEAFYEAVFELEK